ncbi:TPA: peptide deformylase [Patescibacteria group bacterium]|nr:peptide deformylase [Patescibacteria group bacterium]
MKIYLEKNKTEEKILRKKIAAFDFDKYTKKEIRELIKKMRTTMRRADGVGLSANQVGLNEKMFVAEVDHKFYAIFNPKIIKKSDEKSEMEEGCLSVPDKFGTVIRADKVWLEGQNADGKKLKIKARGFLARVFQHELDHLEGKLFIDKSKDIYSTEK